MKKIKNKIKNTHTFSNGAIVNHTEYVVAVSSGSKKI